MIVGICDADDRALRSPRASCSNSTSPLPPLCMPAMQATQFPEVSPEVHLPEKTTFTTTTVTHVTGAHGYQKVIKDNSNASEIN